jgi:hypothetical protein
MPRPALLDPQVEQLISELATSLEKPARFEFVDAARAVVAALPYLGPGAAYHALKPLQRQFFQPPDDTRVAHGPRQYRPNKLADGPPIGAEPRTGARARNSFRAV